MSTRRAGRHSHGARRGFTLIEVMVVLAIAAVVTSITVSGFRSLTDGNRRTTCQTNMSQLYASLRLYAADEGGAFPYYNPDGATGERNIGLWALYAFPQGAVGAAVDTLAPVQPANGSRPVERYLRSAKVLHCPADLDTTDANGNPVIRTSLLDPDDQTRYNRNYMSYHVFDNNTPNDLDDDENLYLPIRTTVRGTSSTSRERETWQRQLLPALPDDSGGTDPDSLAEVVNRPPTGDTVVTWCPWHRGMRDFDNVLFYDGSIQILPRTQQLEDNNGTNASCATLAPGDCVAGADRKPTAPK